MLDLEQCKNEQVYGMAIKTISQISNQTMAANLIPVLVNEYHKKPSSIKQKILSCVQRLI
jgi:hypothetical protein